MSADLPTTVSHVGWVSVLATFRPPILPWLPALLWVERRQWFPVWHEATDTLGDLRQQGPGRGKPGGGFSLTTYSGGMTSKRVRVADLFCGPGGISEGMRLGGCDIVFGLDKAKDAVATFGANHPQAIARVADATTFDIDDIPDFEVLVGGPPCVNFSQSKGGRANILEGLRLVQTFLRCVYERKPKYWIMENVPRIALHLPEEIPLSWIGLDCGGYLAVPQRNEFNCADFGVPQNRKRYLIGNYPVPAATHQSPGDVPLLNWNQELPKRRNLRMVLEALGSPYGTRQDDVTDPNYGHQIPGRLLADHSHDVDLNEREVRSIRAAKTEHPFMGFMPFPDEIDRPARTVVATQLGRETLVLETELGRYRRATVRECATLQTFPIDYHFLGRSVGSRYRQAGDAVPALLTMQIAKKICEAEGYVGARCSVARGEREPPRAAIVVARKNANGPLPSSKRFIRIVPSKEVRGSRVDFDNRAAMLCPHPIFHTLHPVGWAARLHLGEGRATKREKELDVDEAVGLLAGYGCVKSSAQERLAAFARELDKELVPLVPDASTLQAIYTRRHNIAASPDEVVDVLISLVNRHYPRRDFSDEYVPPCLDLGISLPRKGIRVRIIAGGLAAAFASALANDSAAWAVANPSLVYEVPDSPRRENTDARPISVAGRVKTLEEVLREKSAASDSMPGEGSLVFSRTDRYGS